MDGANLVAIIMFGIAGIVVWYLIISAATKSDRKVRNQDVIIYLLIKICEKNGVPPEELVGAKKSIGMK